MTNTDLAIIGILCFAAMRFTEKLDGIGFISFYFLIAGIIYLGRAIYGLLKNIIRDGSK